MKSTLVLLVLAALCYQGFAGPVETKEAVIEELDAPEAVPVEEVAQPDTKNPIYESVIDEELSLTMDRLEMRREQLGENNPCLAAVERVQYSAARDARIAYTLCNDENYCLRQVERAFRAVSGRQRGHSTICI